MADRIYSQRKWLRKLEKGWTAVERLGNRLSRVNHVIEPYNPLYHLGTLAIFLLVILLVTGIYLTIFYRPGTERAYASVAGISGHWLGSLVRSVHRHATNGLILVVFLHALKMLLSDRFWGSRWLSWVSGWVLLVLFWLIAIMGYWLVWDRGAQWLTEYFIHFLGGTLAQSFWGTNPASASFSLFVIILFLHVFLPVLLIVGVLVHELRLSRARYWAPRWVMGLGLAALLLLAVLRPAASDLPADLGRLVDTAVLDWWNMGFLPLAARWGNGLFWGGAFLTLALVLALPWLARGRGHGTAVVLPANCTGCGACARECPYDAITMIQRQDNLDYESIALVAAAKCTSCGICVGACPDKAIELENLHSAVLREDLRRTLGRMQQAGKPVITVYTCDRHATLGTLPPLAGPRPLTAVEPDLDGSIPILQAKAPPRVTVGTWPDAQGNPQPVMTCVAPCTGMIHPTWAAETIAAGGAGAIVVSCPGCDCAFREGPRWIGARLPRRRTLRAGNVHFLEAAPGSRGAVTALWALMAGDETDATARQQATMVGQAGAGLRPKPAPGRQARALLAGGLLLVLLFALPLLFRGQATTVNPENGQMRLMINHGGQIVASLENLPDDILTRLPPNVDPAQILGGERFPVRLRLAIDGQTVLETFYPPRGLRREGAIFEAETVWLPPGTYETQLWMMDDETAWRPVFTGTVTIEAGEVRSFVWQKQAGAFELLD